MNVGNEEREQLKHATLEVGTGEEERVQELSVADGEMKFFEREEVVNEMVVEAAKELSTDEKEVKINSMMRRLADPFVVNEITLTAAEASFRRGKNRTLYV
jgi:hypothetical protein